MVGEHLVVLLDRGFLTGNDAATGKETRARKRISHNANAFTASPWAYNDHLFCLAEDGTAIARGLSNYTSSEARRTRRKPPSDIEAVTGFLGGQDLSHRDTLVQR
mgnify:CR=1 FL=1